MPVDIRGKNYVTVSERVAQFRAKYGNDFAISTDLRQPDDDTIIARCEIHHITDRGPILVATGHAHERWSSDSIHQTSAYEIAETSAIGRALGFLGFAISEDIASADEVSRAIEIQENEYNAQRRHMCCVRDNLESVYQIKTAIAVENWSAALESWSELDRDVQQDLWRAPSKGGIFTTQERELIRDLRRLAAEAETHAR